MASVIIEVAVPAIIDESLEMVELVKEEDASPALVAEVLDGIEVRESEEVPPGISEIPLYETARLERVVVDESVDIVEPLE